ncbi:nucleolar GTP-binding protein 1, partial [Tanacetum coccineum]
TKSLFVWHTDYKYLRYQVIDTPGILDMPFEDRNIIEMCSITALVHLRAAVLFFLDISGSCGYTIAQQAALFHSIKSLFMNKPLIIVCNKTDLQSLEGIAEDDKKLVEEMKSEALKTLIGQGDEVRDGAEVLLTMSTLTEERVMNVKNAACERLLDQRVEIKMKSKKMNECLNRLHVAVPKPRDYKERPICIRGGIKRLERELFLHLDQSICTLANLAMERRVDERHPSMLLFKDTEKLKLSLLVVTEIATLWLQLALRLHF